MIRFAPAIEATLQSNSPMVRASGVSLRQSSIKARQLSGPDRTVVQNRIVGFLRRRYPYGTVENVAADTGIKMVTIAKWLERDSAPSVASFVHLFGVYGPEFLAAVCPDQFGWLDEAARVEHDRKIDAQIEALNSERLR